MYDADTNEIVESFETKDNTQHSVDVATARLSYFTFLNFLKLFFLKVVLNFG